jgi:predicted permease
MTLMQDLRLAARLMRRAPLASVIALGSIALSVGATAVVFAAIKSVLLDPLPFSRPAELVGFRSEYPAVLQQSIGDWVVWNDAREIDRRTRTLGPLGIFGNAIFDLAGDAGATPEALYGVQMNSNLFRVLGVQPMLGRNMNGEEDAPGHAEVMLLSYGLWVRRFQGDPAVVGRTVTGSGRTCQIIGVMPPGFNFPLRRSAAHTPSPYVEFWMAPFHKSPNPAAGMGAVSRLRSGVTLQQARQDLAAISADLAREFPETNRGRVLDLNGVLEGAVGAAGTRLWLLMAAAVLFMLIGCANVANLLLARGFARQREMAVRLALGARPRRLVRQLFTESCLLAVGGGVAGYLLTAIAWHILPAVAPVSIPRLAAARADGGVFGFAVALAIVNGVLFGIAPALRMAGWARASIGTRGAASGRRDRVGWLLVSAEVALSLLLVVTSSQVVAGFQHLMAIGPGFQPDHVLASVVLPAPLRYREPERRSAFYHRILDAVRALPGVESAGTTDALPFSGENHGGFLSNAEGPLAQPLTAEVNVVGGDYLRAMGIRLLEGRWFREEEMNPANDSAIVSTLVAQRLWPGESAIGQRICVFCTPEHPGNWKRVIGVVSGANHIALDEPSTANVYQAADAMQRSVFLVVRSTRPAGEMEKAIRRAIATLDPEQPVLLSASMRELIADSVADRRFVALLLGITGALALLLSTAGVYGVVSYTTSRRTREIGIRMAVGATPGKVLALIFRQGFRAVALGMAAGVAALRATARPLAAALPGVEWRGGGWLWMAGALVIAAAAIACWIPARRATGTDPMAALREE